MAKPHPVTTITEGTIGAVEMAVFWEQRASLPCDKVMHERLSEGVSL